MKTKSAFRKGPAAVIAPACILLLMAYFILKHFFLSKESFEGNWSCLISKLGFSHFNNEDTTTQTTFKQPIANPISDIEDANPVDKIRLFSFLLACLLFVVPYLV
ncbi:uncharacterized protein TDEL_0B04790 [Torulaspora delbrueckii]|uniref:Uncharacterized protein n=1 Tax=Torulaspora delbrueckii TaxID=4950 RepID=G8ZPR4_TORDE|nr:hypothetical protein TDEL_0B04790 [Torulaspora delbrueckii]CCE90608.1 hypothetical protein TDEL_0B04790 [Torulaspora delbrueckii]